MPCMPKRLIEGLFVCLVPCPKFRSHKKPLGPRRRILSGLYLGSGTAYLLQDILVPAPCFSVASTPIFSAGSRRLKVGEAVIKSELLVSLLLSAREWTVLKVMNCHWYRLALRGRQWLDKIKARFRDLVNLWSMPGCCQDARPQATHVSMCSALCQCQHAASHHLQSTIAQPFRQLVHIGSIYIHFPSGSITERNLYRQFKT